VDNEPFIHLMEYYSSNITDIITGQPILSPYQPIGTCVALYPFDGKRLALFRTLQSCYNAHFGGQAK